jgi:hypothetical protein
VSETTINLERLRQLLFAGEDESAYAVLDGASIPDLLPNMLAAPEEHACLYRGELEPDLAEVAPYLVKLRQESSFTEWILSEGWGNHWGIFAVSQIGLEALRRHFRHFLRVKDPAGKVLYFRFYDPRVLRVYLPTCKRTEIKTVYGPISRYIAEDGKAGDALIFPHHPAKIKVVTEPLSKAGR